MTKCPICNNAVSSDTAFCTKCGARLTPGKEPNLAILDLITEYQQRVGQQPDDANARYNLALAHSQAQQYGAAIQQLELVCSMEADFVDALHLLAICRNQIGDKEGAEAILCQLRQDAPSHPKVLN